MSRRRRPEKRVILPDPKFGDQVLSKFMNAIMRAGKKSTAERIVSRSLSQSTTATRSSPAGRAATSASHPSRTSRFSGNHPPGSRCTSTAPPRSTDVPSPVAPAPAEHAAIPIDAREGERCFELAARGDADPEAVFERAWALEVLEEARGALLEEAIRRGRTWATNGERIVVEFDVDVSGDVPVLRRPGTAQSIFPWC